MQVVPLADCNAASGVEGGSRCLSPMAGISSIASALVRPRKYPFVVCVLRSWTAGLPPQSYLLLGEEEYLGMFYRAYGAAMHRMQLAGNFAKLGWLVDVHIHSGALSRVFISSLSAFWPGMQALAGVQHVGTCVDHPLHRACRRVIKCLPACLLMVQSTG